MKFNQRLRVRLDFSGDIEFKLSEYTGAVERPNGTMFIADRGSPIYHYARTIREHELDLPKSEILLGFTELIALLEGKIREAIVKDRMSPRLKEAISVHMVDADLRNMTARILPPPHAENLSDEDWLLLMRAGTEISRELRELGFTINNSENQWGRSPLRDVYASWRQQEDIKNRIRVL